MAKKVGVVLLISLLSLAVGLWLYRMVGSRLPARPGATSRVETPRTPPPSAGTTSAEPAAPGPSSGKGSSLAPPEFTPRAGEVLDFAANVTKLNSTVANLQVRVAERRSFAGKNAWHLQAF